MGLICEAYITDFEGGKLVMGRGKHLSRSEDCEQPCENDPERKKRGNKLICVTLFIYLI